MTARTLASILAPLGLAVSSCGVAARPADTVVYASGTDLESANPLVTVHPLSRQMQRHVLFVTLVRYDSALTPRPYYARAWRWTPDRLLLTLFLDPAVRWHDGVPTTAADVAFTLLAARDPRSGFPRSGDLAVIDTAEATSDTSVAIRFRSAQRDLPPVLAELPVLPRHRLSDIPLPEMKRAEFNMAPVGNGPFRFARRIPGRSWTFQRNSGFPASLGGPPRIRELIITVVDEATTKFAGLAAGDLDFAGIAPTMAHLAARDPTIEVLDYPVLFSNALVFNVHRPPFDDPRVRKAVDASIDRGRLVAAALAGFGTPATGPVPPENPLALRLDSQFDTLRADSLLDAAGWRRSADRWRRRDGKELGVELLTVGGGDVEQLIQADLANRGIRVAIRQLELAAFLARARLQPKAFDMLVTGIPGDLSLAHLGAMFESGQRGGTLDYAGFHAPELDRLFALARAARSEAELFAAWQGVQRFLATHVPVSWLYHSRGVQGVASRMRGVVMDLRGELVSVASWSTAQVTGEPAGELAADR